MPLSDLERSFSATSYFIVIIVKCGRVFGTPLFLTQINVINYKHLISYYIYTARVLVSCVPTGLEP